MAIIKIKEIFIQFCFVKKIKSDLILLDADIILPKNSLKKFIADKEKI